MPADDQAEKLFTQQQLRQRCVRLHLSPSLCLSSLPIAPQKQHGLAEYLFLLCQSLSLPHYSFPPFNLCSFSLCLHFISLASLFPLPSLLLSITTSLSPHRCYHHPLSRHISPEDFFDYYGQTVSTVSTSTDLDKETATENESKWLLFICS